MNPVAVTLSDGAAATLIAAGIAGVISLVGLWVNGLRRERGRRREHFAKAFAAVVAYQEFPYAIRRRRHDRDAEERVRVSEALREVQQELAFHQAWVDLEGTEATATAYRDLIAATRRVAGGYMHEAWKTPPIERDEQMNITGIDYAELRPLEKRFLEQVAAELSWAPRRPGRVSSTMVVVLAITVFVTAVVPAALG